MAAEPTAARANTQPFFLGGDNEKEAYVRSDLGSGSDHRRCNEHGPWGIFFRTRVVVAPAVVAPVAVAPVAVTPVVAAPVVAAPVAVAPVYVPTCRLVAVPVVNTWTGATYMVTRRVCR
jgi:hypothetical protein